MDDCEGDSLKQPLMAARVQRAGVIGSGKNRHSLTGSQ